MSNHLPLITTKIIVPTVKKKAIRRMKLAKKLKNISKFPLTIVHSAAGYGKSTSLALFVSDEKPLCSWYTVTSADDNIVSFLSYMTASIQTIFPQFGFEFIQSIQQCKGYPHIEGIRKLCSVFINEVMAINQEFYLIIDDFHLIEHSYSINQWMEQLLCFLPQNFHIVISGRTKPNWKHLPLMKVQERLLEINKSDLYFSEEEAEMLLSDTYHLMLQGTELRNLYQLTRGWVIGLCLTALNLKEGTAALGTGRVSEVFLDLFQYIESEVFSNQPPIIQKFLEQTSVLEELTVDMCNLVLGITVSEGILVQLTEENLLIEVTGKKKYQFHPLFKVFLEDKLRQNHEQRYFLLHEKCARFYEEKGDWQAAIFHFEKMKALDDIASLLNEYGKHILSSGELDYLHEKLRGLPNNLKDRYYRLWFIQGEVFRYRSMYKEAEQCYEWSISAAEKHKDNYEVSKGLEGKAKIYLDTIQPYKAKRYLYKVIELRESCEKRTDTEMSELYHLLAENLINSGQAKKAEKWLLQAQSLHAPNLDRNLEARLFLRTGRIEKAKRILLESLKKQNIESSQLPQSHRETSVLLSLIESFMGNSANAKSLAKEGIQLGVRIESPFVEACGWIRMGHAIQIVNRYHSVSAVQCYETALEIMGEIKVERGKAEPLMGLCIYYGFAGEYEKAIEIGHFALAETEKVQDMWLTSWITLSMAIASINNQHFSKAEEYLAHSKTLFEECGDDYGMAILLFWYSYYYYQINEMDSFRKSMEMLIKSIQSGRYEFIFHKHILFGPRDLQMIAPLLIEANKQKISPQFIPKLLQEMNISHLDIHPGYTLRIQTLGSFRVWLGDKEIVERDWQRGKAKELLQLFITKYGTSIAKDDIYDLLWPNQSEKNAARDLKVALNALNNVLEPKRKARANPFFIQREGSSYGINKQVHMELDALIFEDWITAGLEEKKREKAIQFLSLGLEYYKGDYLPERKYDDWCLSLRERLLVLFIRGAEKLAQLKVSVEDYNGAIQWCERILEREHTWEEAYRLLMYCYYKKENRTLAFKWYNKCCGVLKRELGVKPLESTLHMYHMILNSQ